MNLLLVLLLLTPIALAQDWRELEVKGRLTCLHHGTADLWSFNVSLVRRPKESRGSALKVVDNKIVTELAPFSLQSPSIGPFVPIGHDDYFLNVDSVHGCDALPKSLALDSSKRDIDLGLVDLTKI